MKPTRKRLAVGSTAPPACVSLVLAALALNSCATYSMMPTPVLYTGAQAKTLFIDIAADRRTPSLDLLYVTDRAPATSADDSSPYTASRSRYLAFGSTTIEFGNALTWDTLVAQSTVADRKVPIDLTLGPTTELGRFPRIPYEIARATDGISRAPDVVAAHEAAKSALQAEVGRRLALAPRKEVVLFVHGYANTFADAALNMGELCHFLGREFVCAVFSWPAGGSKIVYLGYDVDRESGEFAEEDLKKTIRMIADTPGLEKIHLVAHSRGTDLIASAVSDLGVEAYITQTTLARRFKIGNIVLIAPDLDIDVAPTKIWKTSSDPDLPYGKAPNPGGVFPSPAVHITVYVSQNDKALATSGWLLGSIARLGRIDVSTLAPEDVANSRLLGSFDVIQVTGERCFICHSYFVSDPRVSSDLIALLRYGLTPNEPGRPLVEVEKPFWRVPMGVDSNAPQ
jgi:esterase/lipase superfamily enzyme